MGEVCIVTNSVEGWVDYCSRAFMSLTHDVIVAKMIPVVSARDASEREFPSDPQRWKTEAFRSLLAEVKNEVLSLQCRL